MYQPCRQEEAGRSKPSGEGAFQHMLSGFWLRLMPTLILLFSILGAIWLAPGIAHAQTVDPAGADLADISTELAEELVQAQGPVTFLVVLKDQVDSAAKVRSAAGITDDPLDPRARLYESLTAEAIHSQAALRAWLDAEAVAYRPFYLVNMLEVTGDAELAERLRRHPEIDRLVRNPLVADTHTIGKSLPKNWRVRAAAAAQATAALPYGLGYTKADQVWALGYTGQGVVIASQDTGVQWDHPALLAAYRGWDSTTMTVTHPYNWYDAFGRNPLFDVTCSPDPQVPCDDQGHGTHTVGTMVGDDTDQGGPILGMAPGAEWIACRNMQLGVGSPASYSACFEFLLAPFPQNGDPFTDGRPELGANVVNNSWGCPPSEGCDTESLRLVIENVRAAGIFVAASAGNKGPSCASVNDPLAIYDSAFSVGAHDATGAIASFSSRGPVTVDGSNRPKPDIAAPGVAVYSTYRTNNYAFLQGTSMASPHVAGAVALLWSAVPALTGNVDLTEQVLIKSAVPVSTNECGEGSTPATPNFTYGYGRLDILAAVELAQNPSQLTVQLIMSGGEPVIVADAQLTDRSTGYRYPATSTLNDVVRWSQLYPGAYDLDVVDAAGSVHNAKIDVSSGLDQHQTITLFASKLWLPIITK